MIQPPEQMPAAQVHGGHLAVSLDEEHVAHDGAGPAADTTEPMQDPAVHGVQPAQLGRISRHEHDVAPDRDRSRITGAGHEFEPGGHSRVEVQGGNAESLAVARPRDHTVSCLVRQRGPGPPVEARDTPEHAQRRRQLRACRLSRSVPTKHARDYILGKCAPLATIARRPLCSHSPPGQARPDPDRVRRRLSCHSG